MAHPLETFLAECSRIHGSGAGQPETSYYGPLEALFNAAGDQKGLKPKVRCVVQLGNRGAGSPDLGLYAHTKRQLDKDAKPLEGVLPESGVVEVKPPSDAVAEIAVSAQAAKYAAHYGQVLVTNLREFLLVVQEEGKLRPLEGYVLAGSEEAFWEACRHPRKTAEAHGERLFDFLLRVYRHQAPLAKPEDLAWYLASYAREARARVELPEALPKLVPLRDALSEALGLTFTDEKGEHFFRATLVQTLFYGVFSAWVLWCREGKGKQFDWHDTGWHLHVPMIATLFEQIAQPSKLKDLKLDEVLDWAGMALDRVDRAEFFKRFEEEYAVQYFYEPFLKAYDPELRKDLGVWYTPPEIVRYQVERVDRVLREELAIADGLADKNVVVLDPCCGTGAYLVEVIRRIHETMQEKGAGATMAQRLKEAVCGRVYGFELLPAPFVVAHLQLGLMLHKLGAPLDHDAQERAGVYLTNALTGWEPLEDPKDLLFPELAEERDAANRVKQDAPIIVILGNPPYNAFAGTSPEEEGGLVDAYKEGLTKPISQGGWGIKKFNLDDLYVRFFRIAERRIVKSGRGVVSYISNFSYLGDPSFVVMRKRLLDEFDQLWFDCMNGDSRETGKVTPDGKPDPSVFSTEDSPIGIRVGTAICMLVRTKERTKRPQVRFRHFWGSSKRTDLLASLDRKAFARGYDKPRPSKKNRYSFRPALVDKGYLTWPQVAALCEVPPCNGLMEKRGGALMDADREALAKRMRAYFDRKRDWDSVAPEIGGLAGDAAGYDARATRKRALQEEHFDQECIHRYALRPFDTIWCYYSAVHPVWNRCRASYYAQCWEGNGFLMARPSGVALPEGVPVCYTSVLGDNDFQRGHAYYFPIRIRRGHENGNGNGRNHHQTAVFEAMEPYSTTRANLSERARAYLAGLGIMDPDHDAETAGLVWMHALAIGYSPAYLEENADGIRQDWPRIPLPAKREVLEASAALGRQVAALLDTEKPVEGVTTGTIRPELKKLGVLQTVGGVHLDPKQGHLDVTAGWGHAGARGVCMPGKGKSAVRTPKPEETVAGLEGDTLDVFLNDVAYWENVPQAVWDYHIGGYQVIKKWLSYREKAMLGRALTLNEAEYVTEMVRRIAALILLQPALDANYETVKADTYDWPGDEQAGKD